jgi:hypothetical protein
MLAIKSDGEFIMRFDFWKINVMNLFGAGEQVNKQQSLELHIFILQSLEAKGGWHTLRMWCHTACRLAHGEASHSTVPLGSLNCELGASGMTDRERVWVALSSYLADLEPIHGDGFRMLLLVSKILLEVIYPQRFHTVLWFEMMD